MYRETKLFRAGKLYTAKNYQMFIEAFKKNFPEYIYFCPFRGKELISAPLSKIETVYFPRDCLSVLRKAKKPDELQSKALELVNLISKQSSVKLTDFGIHGSIALNMHTPESDMDFVVYGSENFRAVENAISELVNIAKLSYMASNRIEAARRFLGRYRGKIWMYNATRQLNETKNEYGLYRYTPLLPLRFKCKITNDSETMFRPATYRITNYKPADAISELPFDKIPERVVSNIGCYRNIARKGNEIRVAGKLERVESINEGEPFYQVVVGTATSEEEYIWPV